MLSSLSLVILAPSALALVLEEDCERFEVMLAANERLLEIEDDCDLFDVIALSGGLRVVSSPPAVTVAEGVNVMLVAPAMDARP